MRKLPVKIGRYSDIADSAEIGEGVEIGNYVEIRENCKIGKFTRIGSHCVLAAGTVIGSRCSIHGGAFFADDRGLNGNRIPPVIENNVKFGTNVKVMGDLTIGINSIIGANSTVFTDVPPHEVWAGTPAKKIRDIKGGELVL